MYKMIFVIILFLSGCAALTAYEYDMSVSDYKKYSQRYQELQKKGNPNVPLTTYAKLVDTPYSDEMVDMCIDKIRWFILDDVKNEEFCKNRFVGKNYTDDDFLIPRVVYNLGIDYDIVENAVNNAREEYIKEEIRISEQNNEKQEKRFQSVANSVQKESGLKLCNVRDVEYYLRMNLSFPKDCIVYTHDTSLQVLEQTASGTLAVSPYVPNGTVVFVQKNSKIEGLSDKQYFRGFFVGTGVYKYTNTLGSTNTVQKLKMLSDF